MAGGTACWCVRNLTLSILLRWLRGAEGKRVALAAWRALQGAHRGGPELALADACLACLDAKLQGIAAAQDASQVSSVFQGSSFRYVGHVAICAASF